MRSKVNLIKIFDPPATMALTRCLYLLFNEGCQLTSILLFFRQSCFLLKILSRVRLLSTIPCDSASKLSISSVVKPCLKQYSMHSQSISLSSSIGLRAATSSAVRKYLIILTLLCHNHDFFYLIMSSLLSHNVDFIIS